ncbi:Autoinducer 2 sensor kinase/phosphatase LuxQ [bioreactor metagenome]|uniref:histidine kinase n=1 Tax=bioreactor metagenome TaxID=1076179 RepID=A0A645AW82_9ZZZZ
MLANISHEIRTPLNSIIGFSQLISEADTKEEREEYFKIVESNNTRLLGLINQILDLSRIDSGVAEFTEEKINVHDFITELHTNYSTFSHDNIKIVVKENLKEGILYSDRNRIFQILSNFINNSLKFTERGIIEIGAIEYPENFEFYIADTGIGISKEKISTIFERFSKIDSFSTGAGLGLAICKSLTEKLGGTISVNSEQGRGSCFKITLPK